MQRALDKIEFEPNSGCWLWAGAIDVNGYGRLRRRTGVKGCYKNYAAHRYVYEALVGKIPEGLDLDHLCRVHCCVNPQHLEPVTRSENIKRGLIPSILKARGPLFRRAICKRGHPRSGDNIRITANGYGACRACQAIRSATRRSKKAQTCHP
jgi:hypothetical protein